MKAVNHIEIDHKPIHRAHGKRFKNIGLDLTPCGVYITFDININTNRCEFKTPGVYINTIKMWKPIMVNPLIDLDRSLQDPRLKTPPSK